MVGVLGLSESSKSDLLAQLDRLGTNLLTVQAGSGIGLGSGELPDEAAAHADAIVIGEAEAVWPTVVRDLESDRLHPAKRQRPLASLSESSQFSPDGLG